MLTGKNIVERIKDRTKNETPKKRNISNVSSKTKFWTIRASSNDETVGEILIYGDIERYKWVESDVTAFDFKKELDELGDLRTLNVYINSLGGDTFAGQAIHSILKRHSAQVNVFIDGIAASAASFIAVAGDIVTMPENAMMMIHNPWTITLGNADELRKDAETLDKIRQAMINAYMSKTRNKISEEKLIELLDDETWMTADEAFSYGFADVISEPIEVAAKADEKIVAKFKHMPESVKSLLAKPSLKIIAGVVPSDVSREKAPEDEAWSAPNLSDFTDENWNDLTDAEKRRIAGHYAWAEEMPPETFGNLKLPHHRPSDGAVVWNGVANCAARLEQTDIPSEDVSRVQSHLGSHYRQFDRTPPWEEESQENKVNEKAMIEFSNLEVQRTLDSVFNR